LKTLVEIAYQKHDRWIEIVSTFGSLKQTEVEDIVQEMYLLLIKNQQKGIDFSYEKDVNYYYVFRILKGLWVDLMRKKCKVKLVELEGIDISQDDNANYEEAYNKIQKVLKEMRWYDAKVFDIINSGESISELSRKSDISYYSLYNTYNKVKQKLKEHL
jgi:DNA-directed RNA polymerase specialized sigma24 family protein